MKKNDSCGDLAPWVRTGSGFLPSKFQGVKFRSQGDPVLYLTDPAGSGDVSLNGTVDGRDVTAFVDELLVSTAPSAAACASDMDFSGSADADDVDDFVAALLAL